MVKRWRTPRLLFAAILLACCGVVSAGIGAAAQNPAIQNPYDQRLAVFEAQYAQATPAEAAVLLARIYGLREFVTDASTVTAFLERAAADRQQHALVRDEALHYLALIDVHNEQLTAAKAKLKALGFLHDWAILGPFTGDLAGPERGFRADASFTDALGRRRSWRPVGALGPQTWIDLAEYFAHPGAATGFAVTSIYSDRPQQIALRLGAESAVALFINGRQVFATTEGDDAGIGFDQFAIAVQLHAGWNSVVLKLTRRGTGSWRFGARVSGMQGGGIQLRAAPHQDTKPAVEDASALPTPADLVDLARATAEDEGNSAQSLEILGRLEQEHARPAAAYHLELAARRKPTADRWLAVARHCGEGPCRLAALNAALHAEPGSEPARLALANYYFGRNQLEKARDLLQQALQMVPGDFVASDLLADLYLSAGLNSAALKETERLETSFPGPLWLKRKLASRYEDFVLLDRAFLLLQQALKRNFDGMEERLLLARLYQQRRDAEGLRRLYESAVEINPADTAALAEIAALDAGAGDFPSGEQTMKSALQVAPESDELLRQFANLLARAGNAAESKRQLARVLELNPHLEQVRRQLEFNSADNRGSDSVYLANAAELAKAARRSAPAGSGNAVELADVRVERVYDNGLSSVHIQQVFYITSEQGARDYSARTVQYAPGSQELRVLHARVYKADGRIIEAEDGGEGAVAEANLSMYYDVRSRTLHFPDLEKHDVVELEYRLSPITNVNAYGDYFGGLVVFRSSVQEQMQRYVLITPARRRFSVVQARMSPAKITTEGGEHVYQWEAHDLPPLPNEPRGPAVTEIAPYVHVSTFSSWQELGRWYAQMIQPQFALDAALREAAARLLNGKQGEREKISAIHEFVLRNTHYVALEFGIYSYKPYPVSQTYARRFGDCKDKASLMIALLRYAGIDADIALVRTRRLGDVDPRATSIALFNHAIVYVPKYDLWLDGTAEYAGSRELPLEDQGAAALVVAADGSAALRRIPVTQPTDNYTRRAVHAQVLADGKIEFTGTAYTRGEDAPGLRREYEIPERQRDSFRDRLAEIFPTVHLEDVHVDGATDLEHDVNVEFRGTLDNFAGRNTLTLGATWMPRTYVQTLAPLATRSQDLLLPAPWTTEEELHFQLPSGAAITALPADTTLNTAFGSASLRYERRGRELVVKTSVQFHKLQVSPAEYPAFREFCAQVEHAFRSEIKIRLREESHARQASRTHG